MAKYFLIDGSDILKKKIGRKNLRPFEQAISA
jgi:hypothetical protein